MGSERPFCVFCEIIAGRAALQPGLRGPVVASGFMGIRPINPGELMLIPKQHIDHFCDVPDALAAHIMTLAQRFSRAIRHALEPLRVRGWWCTGSASPMPT